MNQEKNYQCAFGRHFKEIRLKKFPTYRSLTFASKMSMKTIQRWEMGEVAPTIVSIYKLAKLFQIKPSKLLEFEYDENEDYSHPKPPYFLKPAEKNKRKH